MLTDDELTAIVVHCGLRVVALGEEAQGAYPRSLSD